MVWNFESAVGGEAQHLLFPLTNSECLCRAGTWCCRCPWPREAAELPTATRQRHHNKARAATMLRHHSRSYAHDRPALTSIVYWPARFVEPRVARAHPQTQASIELVRRLVFGREILWIYDILIDRLIFARLHWFTLKSNSRVFLFKFLLLT